MKLFDLSTSKKMYGIDEKCGSVTFVLFCSCSNTSLSWVFFRDMILLAQVY